MAKHLRSSYFCELSLHTEFQSNSTSPSIRLFMALQQQQQQQNEKVNENSGNLVPSLLRKGDQSFSLTLRVRESADARLLLPALKIWKQ